MSKARITCEVRAGCPHPARYQLEVCGVKASEREPTNTCAIHLTVLSNDFLSVSNDVRLRGAV